MGINPKHKGYCTPMTKKTCTPRRKALAKRLKPGGDLYKGKKKQYGGVANPIAEFRKMNEARMGKVVKSYPKYNEGGPFEDIKIEKPLGYDIAENLKLTTKGAYKNPRYAKSAIKSRMKATKKGSVFSLAGELELPKHMKSYVKDIYKKEKKKGTYKRK